MITHYALCGFKSFKRESSFKLAPITLIYGGNSSGKSTIIQSIMLLKQTLEATGSASAPLIFGSKKYVDLGTFLNVVNDHASTGNISIALTASPIEFPARRGTRTIVEALGAIQLQLTVTSDLIGTASLAELTLQNDDGLIARYRRSTQPFSPEDERRMVQRSRASRLQGLSASGTSTFDLTDINEHHPFFGLLFDEYRTRIPGVMEALSQPRISASMIFNGLEFTETDDETRLSQEARRDGISRAIAARRAELAEYTFDAFIHDVRQYNKERALVINRFLPVMSFARAAGAIAGLHLDQRALIESGNMVGYPVFDLATIFLTVGNSIASELSTMAYIGPLRDYPERNYIYSGPTDETVGSRGENLPAHLYGEDRRRDELNELGKIIGLEYDIDIFKSKEPELNSVFALRLTDTTTGADVGLSDVGFGVSQVLPILMQCTAKSDATLVVEQPEIHLNPKLQADLGQVFASAIKGNRRQFIIETHSEHLLLRIQRLVRDGTLVPAQVAVLYVSKTNEGSAVLEIPLAQNGDRLIDWPDGFFDDTYRELFDIAPLR